MSPEHIIALLAGTSMILGGAARVIWSLRRKR